MKNIGSFQFESEIGKGAYATVYKAIDRERNLQVAIKQMDISKPQDKQRLHKEFGVLKIVDEFRQKTMQIKNGILSQKEIENQEALKHILQIYPPVIIQQDQSYIVMKYYTDSLTYWEYLKDNHRSISERTILIQFLQLLSGLKLLHSLQIYHRDLKLENFLYCPNEDELVIIDFGFALYQKGDEIEVCGSKIYSSPQVILCLNYSPQKNDVWSMGIVLYYLTHKRFPICSLSSSNEEFQRSVNDFMEQKLDIVIDQGKSPIVRELLKKMLMRNEEARSDIADIHDRLYNYLYGNKISLSKMTAPNHSEAQRQLQNASSNLSVLDYDLRNQVQKVYQKISIDANQQKKVPSLQSAITGYTDKGDKQEQEQNENIQDLSHLQQQSIQKAIVGELKMNVANQENQINFQFSQVNNNYINKINNNDDNINNKFNINNTNQNYLNNSNNNNQQTNINESNKPNQAKSWIKRSVPNLLQNRNKNQFNSSQNVITILQESKLFLKDINLDSLTSYDQNHYSGVNTTQQSVEQQNQVRVKELLEMTRDFQNYVDQIENFIKRAEEYYQKDNKLGAEDSQSYPPLIKQLKFLQFYLSKLTHFLNQCLAEFYIYQKEKGSFCNYTSNFLVQKLNESCEKDDYLEIKYEEQVKRCQKLKQSFDKATSNLKQNESILNDSNTFLSQRASIQTVKNSYSTIQKGDLENSQQQSTLYKQNIFIDRFLFHSDNNFMMSDFKSFNNYLQTFEKIMDHIEGVKEKYFKIIDNLQQTIEVIIKNVKTKIQCLIQSESIDESTLIKF